MHPEQMTTSQVVEEFQVSRRTVLRRIAEGDLTPLMKLPGATGAYLFDRAEADRVFANVAA